MKKWIRKAASVALCAVLAGGSAVMLPSVTEDIGITADANAGIHGSDNIQYDEWFNWMEEGGLIVTRCNSNSTAITIPSVVDGIKVVAISSNAFRNCSKLKSVTLPSTIWKIEEDPFMYCSSLESIKVDPNNKNFVSVGGTLYYTGFKDAYLIKSVPNRLTTLTIPKERIYSQFLVLYGHPNLKSINVDPGNKELSSLDGVLYNKDKTELLFCPQAKTTLNIPASVRKIITEPHSCHGLTSINVDSKNTEFSSADGVLFNKDKTEIIIYPAARKGHYTIPNSIREIDRTCFHNCRGLTSVTIPPSVKSIAPYAFSECSNLTTIYGLKGTAAEQYAKEQGVSFKEIDFIGLNQTSMTLGKGETVKLTATVSPSSESNKITWRTSAPKILTVDQKGKVKAVGTGTAWITVKKPNGMEKSCKITVKNAPEKVSMPKGLLTLGAGEWFSLSSSVNDGAGCATRNYRTSNSSIVKMTKTYWTGNFVGVKPGVAWVTVRTYNGKEASCKVTVKPAPTSVTISKKNLTMKVGQTASLSCWTNEGSGCATRTFRSSNSSIVKMTKTNWTGEFKAVKPGVAWVTVRTYNGKESSCKITVVK